jgi:predicted RNA-binding Zn-ribbon protein involved in translation (DUF1610 family)
MSLWSRILDLVPTAATREPAQAVFHCDECGAVAATIRCLPRGLPHPITGRPSEESRLVVDGFEGQLVAMIPRGAKRGIWSAVQKADPRAIWRIHDLWAPFYCPECGKSYCQQHWTMSVKFADDYPGWYEETSGRCPNGHTRLLDD